MEHEVKLQELLIQMEKNSRKQLMYSRIQCLFSIMAGLCCIILLVSVLNIIPQINALAVQADSVLSNLELVSEELVKLDLQNMVENINTLVTTGQSGLQDAMEQISQIDVETLNQAIKDLSEVIKPLANLVSRFR